MFLERWFANVRTFLSDRTGNIAITTAFMMVPLLIIGGGAVDLGNAMRVKTGVQNAADSAVLAAASLSGASRAERLQRADAIFLANVDVPVEFETSLTRDDEQWVYDADYAVPNAFLTLARFDSFAMSTRSVAVAGDRKLDVVLVLDSSGSMERDSRMVELKKAVSLFLANFQSDRNIQVALVPFDTQVKADQSAFGAITDTRGENPYADVNCQGLLDPLDRDLCYAARRMGPPQLDCSKIRSETDRSYCGPERDGFKVNTSRYFRYRGTDKRYYAYLSNGEYIVRKDYGRILCFFGCSWIATYSSEVIFRGVGGAPMPATEKPNAVETATNDLIALTPGPWPRCFVDRSQPHDTTATPMSLADRRTLYPEAHCAVSSLEAVTPLTFNLRTVDRAAQRLTPSGNTNITIGVQWGMEALTRYAPMTGARSEAGVEKIMIVLTDGMNTQNRWHGHRERDQIDARTRRACDNARARDVQMFTIRLVDGNETLLAECAGDRSRYHDVRWANELTAVFEEIATEIKGVRLVF